jgi:hypothetical protein
MAKLTALYWPSTAICDVDTVSCCRHTTGIASVGGIAEGRIGAKADIGEINLVLTAETRNRSVKLVDWIELQRASRSRELGAW